MHFTHLPNPKHDLVCLRPLEAGDMDDWYNYLRLPVVYEHTSWNVQAASDLAPYAWSAQEDSGGSVAISVNDNHGHARLPPKPHQQHPTQRPQTAALPVGGHAHLRAVVRCLPVEPSAHRRHDAGAWCFRGSRDSSSLGDQSVTSVGRRVSQAQTTRWWELANE